MKSPADLLTELTEASVVQVIGGKVGTGFFVTPQTIITCAHVIAADREVTTRHVTVVDQANRSLTGWVEQAVPPGMGTGRLWEYPDLCVIKLMNPPEDYPVVPLGETIGDFAVNLTGYSDVYESLSLGTRPGQLAGSENLTGGTFRRIVGCEMPEGLSGGPVVDVNRGVVCGVAKTRRRPNLEMGGLAIPARAIRETFPDVWDWNQEHAASRSQWIALGDALADGVDPSHGGLTNSEWNALVSAAGRLDYRTRKLTQLWRDVVGPLAYRGRPFTQVDDLVHDLSDRPPQNGLDPLIRLFEVFADRFDGDSESGLKNHAEDLAVRNGQDAALDKYRDEHVSHERPVIVIRVEPSWEKGEVNLTAWAYDHWDAPHRQVSTPLEYGPHPVGNVKETILQVLNREVGGLPTIVQLVLPDEMLNEAVETWPLDGRDLGVRHPVVIRFAEWPGEEGQARRAQAQMRSWRGRFESLTMPSANWRSWAGHWVDCANQRSSNGLYGMLNGQGPPFIAMIAWLDGDSVPMPVEVARSVGAPVIVWRHQGCLVRNSSLCGTAVEACPGALFRRQVIDNLSGITFGRLPEEIQQVRARAADDQDPELDLGVAILWEDPDHVPWADPPPNRVPAPPFRPAS